MKNKLVIINIVFLISMPLILALGDMDIIVNVPSSTSISYVGGQQSLTGTVKNRRKFNGDFI